MKGRRDGSMVKVFAIKTDDLWLIPGTSIYCPLTATQMPTQIHTT